MCHGTPRLYLWGKTAWGLNLQVKLNHLFEKFTNSRSRHVGFLFFVLLFLPYRSVKWNLEVMTTVHHSVPPQFILALTGIKRSAFPRQWQEKRTAGCHSQIWSPAPLRSSSECWSLVLSPQKAAEPPNNRVGSMPKETSNWSPVSVSTLLTHPVYSPYFLHKFKQFKPYSLKHIGEVEINGSFVILRKQF